MGLAAILFDIGGVLVKADLERYVERASRVFHTNRESLMREVAGRVRDLEKGRMSSLTFWREIGDSLQQARAGRQVRPRRYARLWSNLMRDSVELNLPLFKVCRRLARQGLILGVLSNVIEDHVQILEDLGVYIPFSPCLTSCRSGMRKPDVDFYRLALTRLGVGSGNCLLVDDNTDNLPPARSQGMRTHLYDGMDGLMKLLTYHRTLPEDDHDPWLVDEENFPWEGERQEQLTFLLNYAVLAPSWHNRQPWRFRLGEDWVEILADTQRALKVADPRNRELVISCGASLELLTVALRYFGFVYEEQASDQALCRLKIRSRSWGHAPEPAVARLFRAIPFQRAEWVPFEAQALEERVVRRLMGDFEVPQGVVAAWLHSQDARRRVAELSLQAARGQWKDRQFRAEVADWVKPSAPGREEFGLSRLEYPLFWRMLPHFDIGSRVAQRESQRTSEASLLCVLSSERDDEVGWLAVGRALAHLLLTARRFGVAAIPVQHPLESEGFRAGLAEVVGSRHHGHPQMVLRLGYGHNVRPGPRRLPREVILS